MKKIFVLILQVIKIDFIMIIIKFKRMKNCISILNEYAQKNNCKIEYIFGSELDSDDNFTFTCNCKMYEDDIDDSLVSFGMSYNTKKESKELSAKNMLDILGINYYVNHDLNEDLKTLDIDVTPIDINQLNKHYIKKLEEVNKAYQKLKENL